jgi:hypothetical protein
LLKQAQYKTERDRFDGAAFCGATFEKQKTAFQFSQRRHFILSKSK